MEILMLLPLIAISVVIISDRVKGLHFCDPMLETSVCVLIALVDLVVRSINILRQSTIIVEWHEHPIHRVNPCRLIVFGLGFNVDVVFELEFPA